MIRKYERGNTTGELADRVRGLVQRGIYPLLFWEPSGLRIVELDSCYGMWCVRSDISYEWQDWMTISAA